MREKDYIVITGSTNIDVAGYSHHSLDYTDSNPRKIKFAPSGVGENIAHNLALLGRNAWFLNAIGGDFYRQLLLAQTNQFGVYVDKCLIVPGENTFSYSSLPDNTGEMLAAINDMSIGDCIFAEFLAQHQEFIRSAETIAADRNLNEETLVWVLENSGETPVFIDPVSAWRCVKIHDYLSKTHTLKPNRLEVETLSGTAPPGREDVTKIVTWFY